METLRTSSEYGPEAVRMSRTDLNEGVVQYEHDGGEPPRPFLVPEEHLANIAYITNLGMSQAELP